MCIYLSSISLGFADIQQWRVQDFPDGRGGGNFQGGDENLLFGQIFPENCMKLKEFGPEGVARVPDAPLDPPLYRSQIEIVFVEGKIY